MVIENKIWFNFVLIIDVFFTQTVIRKELMNRNSFLLCLTLFACMTSFTQAFSQSSGLEDWELVKEKGDLKVYTRKSPDSDIKELRIITTMKAPIHDFIDALNDADSYKTWVYKCESSRLVQKVSDSELYYQVETDFPFPFSNRDLVARTIQKFDDSGIFYSDTVATPDKQPEEKGVVRISLFESHWKVIPQNDGSVYIDYNSKVDPAGYIPQWIVNLGIHVGPIKSMERFTQFVEEWRLNK